MDFSNYMLANNMTILGYMIAENRKEKAKASKE